MKIEKISFHGIEAVALEAGGYEAILIPSVGANVVKLYHPERGVDILRTPDAAQMEVFREHPPQFGMPLWFYHGMLNAQPFVVTKTIMGDDSVEIEAAFYSNRVNDAIYRHFPHEFECRMTFVLSDRGLEQTVTFINDSDTDMPLGVGFHTPIRVPFQQEPGEYRIWLTAAEQWEELASLRNSGMPLAGKSLEYALTNKPFFLDGCEFNGAIIANLATEVKVFYEVDEQYGYWTLSNNGGATDYICPQPQTWAADASTHSPEADIAHFQVVESGDAWSATTKIYIQ